GGPQRAIDARAIHVRKATATDGRGAEGPRGRASSAPTCSPSCRTIRYGRRGGAPGCAAPGCTAPGTIMPGTATAPNGAIFAGTFFGISGTMPFGSTPGRRVSCAWGMNVVGLWFACPGATGTTGGRSTGAASSYGDDST